MSKLDSFTRDQHSPKETCSVANHLPSAIFIHWQSNRLSLDKTNRRLSFTSAHKRADSSEGIQRSGGRERAHVFHCRHILGSTSILTLVSPLATAPRSNSNPIREAAVTRVDVNNMRNSVSLSSKTQLAVGASNHSEFNSFVYCWEYCFAPYIIKHHFT